MSLFAYLKASKAFEIHLTQKFLSQNTLALSQNLNFQVKLIDSLFSSTFSLKTILTQIKTYFHYHFGVKYNKLVRFSSLG